MATNKVKLAIALVQNMLDDLKSGRCTEDEINEVFSAIPIRDNKLNKTQSAKHLCMSLSMFDKRIKAGLINKGTKDNGGYLYWERDYLDTLIENSKKKRSS